MRKPDRETQTAALNGLTATIKVWINTAEHAWDGDLPLLENSEGFDLLVEASLTVKGQHFSARDSLGGVWIQPNPEGQAYLEEEIGNVTYEALKSLREEIKRVASGADVRWEEARAKVAQSIAL